MDPNNCNIWQNPRHCCGLAVEHLAHDQKVMGSIPVNPTLDGSGVKAMSGSISTPNSGSL